MFTNGWGRNVVNCYDNRVTMTREWILHNVVIYQQSAESIAERGITIFGAYGERPTCKPPIRKPLVLVD